MKSITTYIFESINKKQKTLMKCKTLEKLFCKFADLKNLSELTEDDLESFDYGYTWFNSEDEMSLSDFVSKIKSYGNKPIENFEFDDKSLSNVTLMSFDCNGDHFEIDCVF